MGLKERFLYSQTIEMYLFLKLFQVIEAMVLKKKNLDNRVL